MPMAEISGASRMRGAQRPIGDPLDRPVPHRGERHPRRQHDQERQREGGHPENLGEDEKDQQRDERRQHEHVAMGEIDHADDAVHHRIADGDETIDRSEREPVDELLQEIVHASIRPRVLRPHAESAPTSVGAACRRLSRARTRIAVKPRRAQANAHRPTLTTARPRGNRWNWLLLSTRAARMLGGSADPKPFGARVRLRRGARTRASLGAWSDRRSDRPPDRPSFASSRFSRHDRAEALQFPAKRWLAGATRRNDIS